MKFSYLGNKSWSDITREERYFCAELYFALRGRENELVSLIDAELPTHQKLNEEELGASWDIAYEVCFYRDYLAENKKPISPKNYSPKRTFDICLFSEKAIIIVEAKAALGFDKKQLDSFQKDRDLLKRFFSDVIKQDVPRILIVALTSSVYRPAGSTVAAFDASVSWSQMKDITKNAIFDRADRLYGASGIKQGGSTSRTHKKLLKS